MKLRNQVILVNLGIAIGLGVEAVQGVSKVALLVAGIGLYFLANVIFWFRAKKAH